MTAPNQPDTFDAVRRAGIFLLLAMAVWLILPAVFRVNDLIFRSAISTLVAGLLANLIVARVFEEGRFSDFGLGWQPGSGKQLVTGFALGFGSVGALALAALAFGIARIERVPVEGAWPLPVLAILLWLGALGEEMMFRGYAFQILARVWSAPGTIATTGILFGVAHFLTNKGINPVGTINTALWGAVLGYACWRTRALWLPAGLHFGWNAGLVAIGVPLSGLTIKATGLALQWSAGELVSGGMYGPENGLLTTVCGGLVFLFLHSGKSFSDKGAGGDS